MTEPSYFIQVAQSQKYLGRMYHNEAQTRPSDLAIIAYQRPIGWSFFSYSNVELLLKQCRRIFSEIIFADISDTMAQVYEENAAEVYAEPGEQTLLVQRLNELFFERWIEQVKASASDERLYMEYIGNPDPAVSYPENVNKKDRSIIPNEHDLSTYSDNQGVHFDSGEDALFKILGEPSSSANRVVVGSLDDPLQY
jgi:hypothetical protein